MKTNLFGLILLITGSTIMGLSDKEKQTISYYHERAQKWIEGYGDPSKQSFWENELKRFHTLLPTGNILEIGVGGALEAGELIKMGYNYTGIDPVEPFITSARKKYKEGMFIQTNVYDLNLKTPLFDGFWCSATLLHIPYETIDLALQQIKKCMKSGAIGFISLLEGQEEFFDKTSRRFFYLYKPYEFANILNKNGFRIEQQTTRKKDTQKTLFKTWITYFVRVR